jgi:DNA-binding transcriptional regulator YiaG
MNIRQIRTELGLSQEVFAVMVGRTAKTLRRYEKGLIDPPEGFFQQVEEIKEKFSA